MEETTTVQTDSVTTESSENKSPKDQLNDLIARRMGSFEVKINYADLKHLRNLVHQKLEWKGPNEAYLTIIALLTMDNALSGMDSKSSEQIKISLPSSVIESINFFLNKITGKGLDSAQRIFSLAMLFRPAIEAIKTLDNEIEHLKSEVEKTEKIS